MCPGFSAAVPSLELFTKQDVVVFFVFFYILKQFIVCFDIFKEHSVYEECHFIGLYCSTSQFLGDQQGSNV